ncbi:hypothetical protein HORIV_66190 [Vreelandella olivaria]|uniref:GCVT N-terminal domain-containing protein n=1 Tax=Vreelandella olivaria TaxID=390919 RepID=A0ABM7GTL5_9GAMM|nr:hypothetical protein HORIV_66190 [Halomonas olivaria]
MTDHWATMTITGPEARKLLAEISDIDLDRDSFKFMDWRSGKVAGCRHGSFASPLPAS